MDQSLPSHLAERFRWLVGPAVKTDDPGGFVLYWMHNAVRAHENPALDVAICLARQNGLPLLVYHALAEDYPYASDRYHAFILQGHRDVQRELRDRGITSYFHLQRGGDRGPHLRDLTRQAAVLVTEEMPVQPLAGWMERLVSRTSTPIATVDASCVVPVPLVKKSFTRAFQYRDATQRLYEQRVDRPYVEQPVDCPVYDGALPFQSLDLQDVCLASLIGQCKIDHAIAPVADTPGGSRAGYARWDRFQQFGLPQYAKRRNDATIHDGVSRMSAYLHFGMVSPFRIARQASEAGAEKFLDELLIWRELSFHFCHHNIDVIDSLHAIPDWAQKTLHDHQSDSREGNYAWEQLARGKTGQPLWDACQRSLLKHGELHNNVRMTWGKAFLPWATSPARAMQLTMDLNHRYALDGRDPCSYGGVLWCFGQFDRPFSPEHPVIGAVRPRSCEDHQQRIDFKRYVRIVDRPIARELPRVAVVGAGIGGLIAARTIADHGLEVTVFDKSAGVGGRLATRVIDDELAIDHGAQYFTARDSRFCRYVQSWMHEGLVKPWMGRIVELGDTGEVVDEKLGTPRYVGVPSMNAVAKHLAKELSIERETTVAGLKKNSERRWLLDCENGGQFGPFDVVLFNAPPKQTVAIIEGQTEIAAPVASVEMRPCWALLLRTSALDTGFDGAFINSGPLSWIARDESKPGRNYRRGESQWILHASADWSQQHLEDRPAGVQRDLIGAFESAVGKKIGEPLVAVPHRWRYAIPARPLPDDCLWDSTTGIGVCGDWCGGPRVEGAFLSGVALAGTLLRHVTIDRPAYKNWSKAVQPALL